MPPTRPDHQIKARKRMMLMQQALRAVQNGVAPPNDRRPVDPSPQRRAPVDPREGELRTEGEVARTGPRAGSKFTEIIRNGRVFHKYGDDLGTGLGPEVVEVKKPGLAERLVGKNDPAMGQQRQAQALGGPKRNETNDAMARLIAEKNRLVNQPASAISRNARQSQLDQIRRRIIRRAGA